MDYPDPDEEYELMYAEELEIMREMANDKPPPKKTVPAPGKPLVSCVNYHVILMALY